MSALQGIGWFIAGVGMIVHLVGSLLGAWPHDFAVTWSVPLLGFALMALGPALE